MIGHPSVTLKFPVYELVKRKIRVKHSVGPRNFGIIEQISRLKEFTRIV